ncbi:hypothetical protein BH10ACT10_BH10ACT10_14750 [soil metagenome]
MWNFFDGMVLTPADLAAEQEYHRGMRYLHNRLRGHGTVSGLAVAEAVARERVEMSPDGRRRPRREIILMAPMTLRLEGARLTPALDCSVVSG